MGARVASWLAGLLRFPDHSGWVRSGVRPMSTNKPVLDRCLRRLIVLGKRQRGFVTYQLVSDILRAQSCDLTLIVLDHIHACLSAEGIEIVDQLPATSDMGREGLSKGESHWKPRPRRVAVRRTPRLREGTAPEAQGHTELVLCTEEALDRILLRAQNRTLRAKDLWAAIEACHLMDSEAQQFIEYLCLRGVDLLDTDLLMLYRNMLKEHETSCEALSEAEQSSLVNAVFGYRKHGYPLRGIKA